jgi:hypothetical protein
VDIFKFHILESGFDISKDEHKEERQRTTLRRIAESPTSCSLPKKWTIGVRLQTTSFCVQISWFAIAKFNQSRIVALENSIRS